MKPTKKSEGFEADLNRIFGFDRRESITQNRCVPPPYGCGQEIENPETHFRDQLSFNEYRISGLCQACQDITFAPHPEDE